MHLSVRIMRLFSFSCIDANWAERMSSECKAFKQKPLLTQSKALIQNKLRCHPQQLESFCVFAIKSAYAIRKTSEPFGISQSICTRTLRNLTRYLHRNLRNRTEPSGASAGIFTRTLRNLTRYLHQIPPERCPKPGVEAAPDRTGANLGQRPHSKVLLLGDKKTQLLLIFLLRSRGRELPLLFLCGIRLTGLTEGLLYIKLKCIVSGRCSMRKASSLSPAQLKCWCKAGAPPKPDISANGTKTQPLLIYPILYIESRYVLS